MQSFKVGAPDAEFLEKEYQPTLGAQDILGIANYKAYLKLNISNTTTRVFSLNSIWTQDYMSEKIADILKKYSEKKYGRKKEFVDAEIAARLGMIDSEDEIPDATQDSPLP
jgi:Cdc6-like AAA superfamily ATPase